MYTYWCSSKYKKCEYESVEGIRSGEREASVYCVQQLASIGILHFCALYWEFLCLDHCQQFKSLTGIIKMTLNYCSSFNAYSVKFWSKARKCLFFQNEKCARFSSKCLIFVFCSCNIFIDSIYLDTTLPPWTVYVQATTCTNTQFHLHSCIYVGWGWENASCKGFFLCYF